LIVATDPSALRFYSSLHLIEFPRPVIKRKLDHFHFKRDMSHALVPDNRRAARPFELGTVAVAWDFSRAAARWA
jgi:hypothetical protein